MLEANSPARERTTLPVVPSVDDVDQLHESARERIRTILKRTQPIAVDPATAELGPPAGDTAMDAVGVGPEVAPIPSALRELPSPYESDGADDAIDLHDAARKRIRKITQPVELPLQPSAARPTTEVAETRAAAPKRSLRGPLQLAGFVVGILLVAGLLNLRMLASALNYDDLGPEQIRALAPELGGGYIIKHASGGQFIGYLVREAGQTSQDNANALAGQLLERLKGRGVRQVVLLDRDNIPVAVMRRGM